MEEDTVCGYIGIHGDEFLFHSFWNMCSKAEMVDIFLELISGSIVLRAKINTR